MIDRLLIRSFQNHDALDLQLERVNVLVGPTGVGKSAILRALRWVCVNQPQGDSFITNGSKSCSVSLVVDSHRITRRKGSSGNGYSLDGEDYVAFGANVPEDIAKLLNVGPINFQRQHDAPFWLGLTPGQAARELNAVVNLEAIDMALSTAANNVRKANADHDALQARVAAARERVEQLAWVPEAVQDYTTVNCTKELAQETAANAARTRQLVADARRAKDRADLLAAARHDAGLAIAGVEPDPKLAVLGQLIADGRRLEGEICRSARERGEKEAELQRLTRGRCPVCRSPLKI